MDTNKVILTGNLTRDVELKATPTGKMVANFTIASNRVYKPVSGEQKKEVMFTRIIAWGSLGETCSKFLRKGSKALVVGRLSSREYESEPGKKVKVFEIIADEVQFLSPKSQHDAGNAGSAAAYGEDNTPASDPF